VNPDNLFHARKPKRFNFVDVTPKGSSFECTCKCGATVMVGRYNLLAGVELDCGDPKHTPKDAVWISPTGVLYTNEEED
jgi:hypothetical protein